MSSRFLGNLINDALAVTRSIYGNEKPLRVINDGQENLVIVADEKELLRFPRSEQVWLASKAERYVLERLSSHSDMPIAKIIAMSENPAYIQMTYLHGNHLTTEQIRDSPVEILQNIGTELAAFAYKLHSAISVDDFRPYQTIHSWSYDDYLKRVLYDRTDPNSGINALAKHYYQAWMNKKETRKYVVHDDLHTGNLLFNADLRLTGVLDFGAVCIGSAEQELRQVYRLGEDALEAAALRYEELSGAPFDRELAKLWVITQELASYCREDNGVVHQRAAENLRFWFPEVQGFYTEEST